MRNQQVICIKNNDDGGDGDAGLHTPWRTHCQYIRYLIQSYAPSLLTARQVPYVSGFLRCFNIHNERPACMVHTYVRTYVRSTVHANANAYSNLLLRSIINHSVLSVSWIPTSYLPTQVGRYCRYLGYGFVGCIQPIFSAYMYVLHTDRHISQEKAINLQAYLLSSCSSSRSYSQVREEQYLASARAERISLTTHRTDLALLLTVSHR